MTAFRYAALCAGLLVSTVNISHLILGVYRDLLLCVVAPSPTCDTEDKSSQAKPGQAVEAGIWGESPNIRHGQMPGCGKVKSLMQ